MALVDANRKVLAEQAAHEERARQVRMLLDSTEEGIYGIDTEGNCTFVNPACLRMLGYRCTDCRYKNPLSGPSNLAANAEIVASLKDPNRLIAAILADRDDVSGAGPGDPVGSECFVTQ